MPRRNAVEVQRVGSQQVEVGVAVAGVELEREPDLQRGVGEPAADRPVGHPLGVGAAQGGDDGVRARLLGGEVQADPVCGDALRGDGATGAEPVLDGTRDVVGLLAEHLLHDPLEADDLVRVAVGQPGQLGRGREGGAAGAVEAGVDEEGPDAGGGEEPPVDLGRAELASSGQVGVGRGERLEVQHRRAVPADREPEHRVEQRRPEG